MKQRELGKTGIFVSEMGLGTVKFGRNQQVTYPHFTLPSKIELKTLVSKAFDLGINILDTAPAYGNSEEIIGELLKGWRKKWIISTKVGEEFYNNKSVYDFSKKKIEISIVRSLQKLQTDYLDLVLLHSNGEDLKILETLDILLDFKKRGLIRAYGMSCKTKTGGIEALKKSDFVMVEYNQKNIVQEPVIKFAEQQNKGILIKKAFQSGKLNNSSINLKKNIKFILQQSAVSSIILGTICPKHLEQNASFFNLFYKTSKLFRCSF